MGQQGGEYEPRDSRNVTGTSTNQTGDRWSEKAQEAMPPEADGASPQAQGGSPDHPLPAPEPEGRAGGSSHTLGASPRDASWRDVMNDQNNQPPTTAAQDQDQGATGQQPDGTYGQRADNSQGGFASAQHQMEDTGANSQTGAAGMNSSGQTGYNAGQQSQFDAGEIGQFRDQLREHMDVIDANGEHCGTIDSVDGDRIKLTREDSADGQHHYVEMGQIAGIEGGQVRLNSTSQAGQADSNAADNWNG